MDNELLLFDRLEVIKTTINQYGEENFYISFSGGKDSTVVHYLVDMALPDNKIPRVFVNTGIEYNEIVKFVRSMAEKDERFVLISPSKPIKETLEKYGYPFKSKEHAKKVHEYHSTKRGTPYLKRYLEGVNKDGTRTQFKCPDVLLYQFTDELKLNVSHLCCQKLKKDPVYKYEKQTGRATNITGMRAAEGGARIHVSCILARKDGTLRRFNPLLKVNDEWEEWFIKEYNIPLASLYYEPYNFMRTGCKGCPFALELQEQLETMERYFPAERKQCEIIWKPVYDEYRRLGYRLKKDEQLKLF